MAPATILKGPVVLAREGKPLAEDFSTTKGAGLRFKEEAMTEAAIALLEFELPVGFSSCFKRLCGLVTQCLDNYSEGKRVVIVMLTRGLAMWFAAGYDMIASQTLSESNLFYTGCFAANRNPPRHPYSELSGLHLIRTDLKIKFEVKNSILFKIKSTLNYKNFNLV